VTAPETAKAATAIAVNGPREDEQLGGELNSNDRQTLTDIQASRLCRLYSLSPSTASTVAALAYGVVR
jgi:hypothetical protein